MNWSEADIVERGKRYLNDIELAKERRLAKERLVAMELEPGCHPSAAQSEVEAQAGTATPRKRTIVVFGSPAPQGSKAYRGMRDGKPVLTEQCKSVKPWRDAVMLACYQEGCAKILGPVVVTINFAMPKPKRPKAKYPDRAPDLDKMCRAVFDALTQAGAIEDDARIVRLIASKIYVSQAMRQPGAVITIEAI